MISKFSYILVVINSVIFGMNLGVSISKGDSIKSSLYILIIVIIARLNWRSAP